MRILLVQNFHKYETCILECVNKENGSCFISFYFIYFILFYLFFILFFRAQEADVRVASKNHELSAKDWGLADISRSHLEISNPKAKVQQTVHHSATEAPFTHFSI